MPLDTIKNRVKEVLRAIPQTRNDDKLLVIEYWKRFSPTLIRMGQNRQGQSSEHIELVSIHHLQSGSGIVRLRAHIQNTEHEYLPTDPEVAIRRGLKESEYYEYFRP